MIEHDFERSTALADQALSLMRLQQAPAIPRNYELFYTYAAGICEPLTASIDQIVATGRKLTRDELSSLYDTYIAARRPDARIESIGRNLGAQIGEILQLVHSAADSSETFGESLKLAGDQLSRASDPEQIGALLQALVATTRKMAEDSHEMKTRLAASRKQIAELQNHLELIRVEASTDPLTGVANRKQFDTALEHAIEEAREAGTPLCLMMVDIDHFKKFNDIHGHQTGDGVLKLVARTMQAHVKGRDMLARYGGEEFGIVLNRVALDAGLAIGEQLRRAVMTKELIRKSTGTSLGRITLSIGIAAYKPGETAETLIHRADSCLYAAKHAGRNCVIGESDPRPRRKLSDAHAA